MIVNLRSNIDVAFDTVQTSCWDYLEDQATRIYHLHPGLSSKRKMLETLPAVHHHRSGCWSGQ